jgi:hypothetical protein
MDCLNQYALVFKRYISPTVKPVLKGTYIYQMSVKSSTELMLYVVLTMPTLNKAYLLLLFIYQITAYKGKSNFSN